MNLLLLREEGSQQTTALIGGRWKCGDILSRAVLITRKLPFFTFYMLMHNVYFGTGYPSELHCTSILILSLKLSFPGFLS